MTNPNDASKPEVCQCDIHASEQVWAEIEVPVIPRWGWSGIDWKCGLCGKLRSDSWSVVMHSNVEWELGTASVVNVIVKNERDALLDAGKGVVDSFNDLLLAQHGGKKTAEKAWKWVQESVETLRSVVRSFSPQAKAKAKPKSEDELSPEADRMLDTLAAKHGLSRDEIMRRTLSLAERLRSMDLGELNPDSCDHDIVTKYADMEQCSKCGKVFD